MSSPIPRRLLPHTASLAPYTGMSGSNPAYGTAVSLEYVRFEAVKRTAMTGLGDQKNDTFLMFFDCKNSLPVGTIPKEKDRITFSGTHTVREVRPCFGSGGAVHHYEVRLV